MQVSASGIRHLASSITVCWLLSAAAAAAATYYPHCPAVYSVQPCGAQVGTQTEVVVEGINLDAASRFLFSEEGVAASVIKVREVANPPYTTPRQQLKLVLSVGPQVPVGLHGFRIASRFGTSNWVPFAIDQLRQIAEVETNNGPHRAQLLTGPVTVLGAIGTAGEQDWYQFDAAAGDEFVFRIVADVLGSQLDSEVALLDDGGQLLASNNNCSVQHLDSLLGHRFTTAGRYYVRLSDRGGSGGTGFFYRFTMGRLPYVTGVFPLGVQRGEKVSAQLAGFNLANIRHFELDGCKGTGREGIRSMRLATPNGKSLNSISLAVGQYDEIFEQEDNNRHETAQAVSLPVTINGTVGAPGDQDVFRFPAFAGQVLAFEVFAHRLNTPLDSLLEILDGQGQRVPRAVLQVVDQASFQLPTSSRSLQLQRFQSEVPYYGGDFVLLSGRELVRLEEGTTHADDFSLAQGFLGRRLAWLGTSSQNHPAGFKADRVRVLKPDAALSGSKLPNYRLDYRNDDGGPLRGKDSYLLFTAPQDGEYLVRLRDLRRNGGRQFAYRLTVRPAQPDFQLFVDEMFMQLRDLRGAGARNPNVPRGGRVPLVVSVQRIDGFEGEIEVQAVNLPPGLTSSCETIRVNEFQTVIVLSAADNASEQIARQRLQIVGQAQIEGTRVQRTAVDREGGLNVVSIVPRAIIKPVVLPERLVLEPGGSAQLQVSIECPPDFAHEVGIEMKPRPPGVFIPGRSTNAGQSIAAGERSRTLTLSASPRLGPLEFRTYVLIRFRSEQTEKMRGIKSLQESADYVSAPVTVTIAGR